MEDPYHYYRSQIIDRKKVLIAGGKDHNTGQTENAAQHLLMLQQQIQKHFDIDEVLAGWSSQYYESVDGLPYIGKLPGHQITYVATGFGGNGMTYSAVAAILLRDLICKGSSVYESLFSPNRLKPVAGFSEFAAHNLHAAKELFKKLKPFPVMNELVSLAKGEAKLVKYEGESLGIYKNDDGHLQIIHPQCTHLKCEVQWNNAELSWDCPCHGARFDAAGRVLNAPADKDLPVEHLQAISVNHLRE